MHRLGVIGRRGQAALWARTARQTPGWRLSACYHPNPGNREEPFPLITRWDDFLRSSDAVVIASPTRTHLGYLRRLAKGYSGLVIVEKPVAANLKECCALLRQCPPGFLKRVYVAQNWRFYPWVKRLHCLLKGGSAGPVLSAHFELSHDFGLKPGYAFSWRSRKGSHPLGPAETQGIHWIDLVHHLLGPVEWVGGEVRRVGRVGSAPDTASILLKTRNGAICSIHTSYVAPVAHYARIVTQRVIFTYRDGRLQMQRQPPPKAGQPSRPAACRTLLKISLSSLLQQPLAFQLKELKYLLAGRNKQSSLVSLQEGIANLVVLEGFSRSLRQGRPSSLQTDPLYTRMASNLLQ